MALGTTSAALRPHRHPRGAHAVALLLSLLERAPATAGTPGRAAAGHEDRAPRLLPRPRSVQKRSETIRLPAAVTLVRGASTDAAALAVVEEVLQDAGVRTIGRSDDHAPPHDRFAVHVGGHRENEATADALSALGVQGAETMAAEGYVLAVGAGRDGRRHIVLSGADPTGTYYAAQTLRRLVRGPRLRGTVIRDWPSLSRRGVVDVSPNPPWSHQRRRADLEWLGRHNVNTYHYAPADDPYRGREHPPGELARIAELVGHARAHHVEFGYVLAPDRPGDPAPGELTAKVAALRTIGVRSFVIGFDHCAGGQPDGAMGTEPTAMAHAQARLANALHAGGAPYPGEAPLQIVPTAIEGPGQDDYLRRLAQELDPDTVVQWTVGGAVPGHRRQLATAREIFGRRLLVRDSGPVGGALGGLSLGPYAGHGPGLAEEALGLVTVPAPRASRIALSGFADYAWNTGDYDPERSWSAALDELTGGDEAAVGALRAFAGLHRTGGATARQGGELASAVAEFRRGGHASPLRKALRAVHEAPAVLRDRLRDPAFLAGPGPWLDAVEAWGEAALTAPASTTGHRTHRGAGTTLRGAGTGGPHLSPVPLPEREQPFTEPGPRAGTPVERGPVRAEFVLPAPEEAPLRPGPGPTGNEVRRPRPGRTCETRPPADGRA
ncbi:beta-N-acetylglucosaminidase domain-containing protein [Streptomyces sp. NPDC058685]|uniref:beta-N-acetylglucosaminidase domain-containing protein n=1 Tax=Streptomyces sp. NPDC058685 TaxID=3346598 RepID=UPI003669AD35